MKRCVECNELKDFECFTKNSKMRDGHINKCKVCMNAYHRERNKKIEVNNDEQLNIYLGYKLNNIRKQDLKKFPDHEFDLTVDDLREIYLRQRGRCIYSNSKLEYYKNTSIYEKISYDRIDNSLPHIKTNLQMTSVFMNVFRGDKTDKEFRELINNHV